MRRTRQLRCAAVAAVVVSGTLAPAALTGISPAAAAPLPAYVIGDISPPGTTYTIPFGITDNGVVTMQAESASWTGARAFSGSVADLTMLDALPGGATRPLAVNATGVTVGFSSGRAALWSGPGTGVTDVGPGELTDVSDAGVAVGTLASAPQRFASGSPESLTLDGASSGEAHGVNESGHVAGWVSDPTPGVYNVASRWTGPSTLQRLPGGTSLGWDIAEDDAVLVQRANNQPAGIWLADGTVQNIPLEPGEYNITPWRMNDAHQVVGVAHAMSGCCTSTDVPFLFDPVQGRVDLQTLIPADSGWTLIEAHDINNLGQIVGYGTHGSGVFRAFLLTPNSPPPDVTPPVVTITSPVDGASYLQGESVSATYSCVDDVDPAPSCTPDASTVDTSTAGTHTFTVTSTDASTNTGSATVTYSVLAGSAQTTTTGGGSLTTDPGGTGATPDVPVQTAIQIPSTVTGTVSVTPSSTTGVPPTGFGFSGTQLQLTGPSATAADPYVVTFTVDATAVGTVAPADVQVFRNGAAIADCTAAVAATPDPCVATRVALAGGDVQVTVRTSQFSQWNVGRLQYGGRGFAQPVDDWPVVNTAKAGVTVPVVFSLAGDRGLRVFQTGSPSSSSAPCPSSRTDALERTGQAGAALSYDRKTDTYTYSWATDKAWSGCRVLTLRFRDGTSRKAAFSFSK